MLENLQGTVDLPPLQKLQTERMVKPEERSVRYKTLLEPVLFPGEVVREKLERRVNRHHSTLETPLRPSPSAPGSMPSDGRRPCAPGIRRSGP